MKTVLVRKGNAYLADLPHPSPGPNEVLVQTHFSSISIGTEAATVSGSSTSALNRIKQNPSSLQAVASSLSQKGLIATLKVIRSKLNADYTSGYSLSGTVIAVGCNVKKYSIGDLVACAGETAYHSEFVTVPESLCVAVPASVPASHASTVALGAIALQGIRRLDPSIGEKIAVIGLGIIGQLTCQILRANGCEVTAVDLDQNRLDIARNNYADHCFLSDDNLVSNVLETTHDYGVDGVIITASSSSHQVISTAFNITRKRGRVVIVGDVGLSLNRADFYAKEIDLLISCSYGPGRYDNSFEQKCQTYPLPYVRWTETRNMSEYLRLISLKYINIESLITDLVDINNCVFAFEELASAIKPLLLILSYPTPDSSSTLPAQPSKCRTSPAQPISPIPLGIVGAGAFFQSVHLPNLIKLRRHFDIATVSTKTPFSAHSLSQTLSCNFTTNSSDISNDPAIHAVLISTRHDTHFSLLTSMLNAGKHVYLEKPLVTTVTDYLQLKQIVSSLDSTPYVQIGYNRRHSLHSKLIRSHLRTLSSPPIINYRMNVSPIRKDSWIQNDEGAGRNIGEACHIYDLFCFLTDSNPCSISAHALKSNKPSFQKNDNFVATISFENGSVCNLTYSSSGNSSEPKEYMEVIADGQFLKIDNFTESWIQTSTTSRITLHKGFDKGFHSSLVSFHDALSSKQPFSDCIFTASQVSLIVEQLLFDRTVPTSLIS